ncbi:Flp family type IVb pilin [Vibrio brasiliensis]|jgi:pilus assembly protein Flp/PilA|uniref:Flp family type IVb pilin n=1 Tax=Vibrio brasiliensis TaxID=170652 RepID=UPI001EFC6735|nr:Flp family type IVb pilin [Vibrio brasiliensis]MCG9751665.1 Flp family type IVb pilin [Vibrio brasiliensis]MCG9782407.1 Flp family type IVb pilin [Vibrio brasiliensis]
MSKLIKNISAFMKDEEGLTVVEYVVGAGLLVAGLAGIFGTFSSQLEAQLGTVLSNAPTGE